MADLDFRVMGWKMDLHPEMGTLFASRRDTGRNSFVPISHAWVWRDPALLITGVTFVSISSRKVVMTDMSLSGWGWGWGGEHRPTGGTSSMEQVGDPPMPGG